MILETVEVGDPHAASHNEERAEVNAIRALIENLLIDQLATTDGQFAYLLENGALTVPALTAAIIEAGAMPLPAWVAAPAPNRFDAQRSVYNFKASNTRKLRAGLGRASVGGQSEHLVIGDSLSAGNIQGIQGVGGLVFDRANAFPRGIQKTLALNGVLSGGTGYVRANDAGLGSPLGWAFTGGVWDHSVKSYSYSLSSGCVCTFTPKEAGMAYTHLWYDGGAAGYNFTINIDGTNYPQVTRGSTGFRTTTVIHNAPITTTSVITITGGTLGHYFAGGKVWHPATGGLEIHNLGQSGSLAYSTAVSQTDRWNSLGVNGLGEVYLPLADPTRTVADAVVNNGSTTLTSATAAFNVDDIGKPLTTPAGALGLTIGLNAYIVSVTNATTVVMSTAALRSASGLTMTFGRKPDVLHLELGANDLSNGVSVANVKAALTAIRNRHADSDVILYVIYQPSPTLIASTTFDAFVGEMYKLADTLDCPLVDLRHRYGTNANMVANEQLGDNAVHPKPSVHADIGRFVGNLLAQ